MILVKYFQQYSGPDTEIHLSSFLLHITENVSQTYMLYQLSITHFLTVLIQNLASLFRRLTINTTRKSGKIKVTEIVDST